MFNILKQIIQNTFTLATPTTIKRFKRQPLTSAQRQLATESNNKLWQYMELLHSEYQAKKTQTEYLSDRNLIRNSGGKFTKKIVTA